METLFDFTALSTDKSWLAAAMLSIGRQEKGLRDQQMIQVLAPKASRCEGTSINAFRQN
jgi:hypothetical protein